MLYECPGCQLAVEAFAHICPRCKLAFHDPKEKISVVPKNYFDDLREVELIEILSHRRTVDSIVRELKEHQIFNGKNYCYECGVSISTEKHFCLQECRDKYFQRYGEKKGLQELIKQTKFRKRNGLPCHQMNPIGAFLKFGRITGPPKLQDFLKRITIETDKENKQKYYQWLLEINLKSAT